jgi:hypothetical protein
MATKKQGPGRDPTPVAADNRPDLRPVLKALGGSQSWSWNSTLANQAIQTLPLKYSDEETRDCQMRATFAALVGIGPKDELEGMMAAQLVAAHNAAMECYRRATIGELRGPVREPRPSQQAFSDLRGAARSAQPPPRQGPAEGHGGARPRACRRAGGGRHGRDPGGRGSSKIRGSTSCKANWPCTAAVGVERGQGAGASAAPRQCRTAAAGCTAGCRRALRRVTGTPSSTAAIRLRPLRTGARLRRCCGK